jgi:hypothetical protein
MNFKKRIEQLEDQARHDQELNNSNFTWVSCVPAPESIEEWEKFAQWQLGNTDGLDLRPEYRQACVEYFEKVKSGLIRRIM